MRPSPIWHKSTRSETQGNCVEVAEIARAIAIRDSKNPAGPVLPMSRRAFRSLVSEAKAARYDL